MKNEVSILRSIMLEMQLVLNALMMVFHLTDGVSVCHIKCIRMRDSFRITRKGTEYHLKELAL